MLEPKVAVDGLILGFDFGMRWIGIASGQTITRTANPLLTIKANAGVPEWQEITNLLTTWRPTALVVGIPWDMLEQPEDITSAAQQFADRLARASGLPVYCVDERLSTKEARRHLFAAGGYRALQKAAVDSYSAKLILETWLQDHT